MEQLSLSKHLSKCKQASSGWKAVYGPTVVFITFGQLRKMAVSEKVKEWRGRPE